MVVQHNLPAMNANRLFGINNSGLSKSLEKLSSGYAINRAGDNAAGLAVSEKMRSQIAGLTQGVKNAQDGISMIQTYEGALTETDNILQRMKTLANQAANGTYQDDVDRDAIQLEFDQLNDELDQIADTDFNGVTMLNGGQMSDGTRADGYGNIKYAAGSRDAQQIGSVGSMVSLATRDITVKADTAGRATFTATKNSDGTITWESSKAGLTLTNNTSNGGFTVNGVAVSVDTSKVVSGDTIVLEFTAGKKTAAQGAEVTGYNETTSDGVISKKQTTIALDLTKPENASQAKALNALNGLTIKSVVKSDGTDSDAADTSVNGIALSEIGANEKVDLIQLDDGSKITIDNAGQMYYLSATGEEEDLAHIANFAAADDAKGSSAGTITTTVAVSTASYAEGNEGSVKLIEPDAVSMSNSNNAGTSTLTYTDSLTLQAGARTKDSINFTFAYESNGIGELKANMNCSSREDGLGTKSLNLRTQENANTAIDKIDQAINKVSMVRATFGATQNRLEHKIDNMNVTKENITSAESRIRDTNMAEEMTNFTKNQILSQASQAMLAQANQLPQGVLQLLG